MKAFNRMMAVVVLLIAAVFAGANLWLASIGNAEGRQYRVDASRAAAFIEQHGFALLDMSQYPAIADIVPVDTDTGDGLTGGRYDYLILQAGGEFYRFDYSADSGVEKNLTVTVNICIGMMSAVLMGCLFFVRMNVIKPFLRLREVPYELSKGNLTVPLQENKHRFFSKFVWGMDMLREKLEQNRQSEIDLQAERKKLILSLSHDIKIPLSAIKLYAKALSRGLYESPEKQAEIAENINTKADEIEGYVSGIVKASREDFLSLEVKEGEFYLSELVGSISSYYTDKLGLLKTEFLIGEYSNCLIKGDCDRAVEVIQNMMENAIKYGDGRKISISFSEEDGCRLVTVANTGCTLETSESVHMFDSFWRGSNSAGKYGNGLGLYICRCLMNKMGGEVFAEIKGGEMHVTAVFVPA